MLSREKTFYSVNLLALSVGIPGRIKRPTVRFPSRRKCVVHFEFSPRTGNPQSVRRLVELLGGGGTVTLPVRPAEPDTTHADISKIRRMIGWEPRVSFEDGVAQVVENIDYWREAVVWTPAAIEDATRTWFQYLGGDRSPPAG